jgi:hypothetical protein
MLAVASSEPNESSGTLAMPRSMLQPWATLPLRP